MRRLFGIIGLLVCAGSGAAQIIPPEAGTPVLVLKSRGPFAARMSGALMPTGKGWKAAGDQARRFQIMLPERWKTDNFPDGEIRLRATPPGADKDAGPHLTVQMTEPADSDPLEVDEEYAMSFADELAKQKPLARLGFKATDAAYLAVRGMKFALAGGQLTLPKKGVIQQQTLVFVAEDRVLWIQFAAPQKEFTQYEGDLVKIFASYSNLGVRKPIDPAN